MHLLESYEELFSATEQICCVSSPQGAPSIKPVRGWPFYRYSTGVSKVTGCCYKPVNEKLRKIVHAFFFPLTAFLETCLYASSF